MPYYENPKSQGCIRWTDATFCICYIWNSTADIAKVSYIWASDIINDSNGRVLLIEIDGNYLHSIHGGELGVSACIAQLALQHSDFRSITSLWAFRWKFRAPSRSRNLGLACSISHSSFRPAIPTILGMDEKYLVEFWDIKITESSSKKCELSSKYCDSSSENCESSSRNFRTRSTRSISLYKSIVKTTVGPSNKILIVVVSSARLHG